MMKTAWHQTLCMAGVQEPVKLTAGVKGRTEGGNLESQQEWDRAWPGRQMGSDSPV